MNNTLNHSKRITKLKRLTKTFLLTGLLLLVGMTAKAQEITSNYGYVIYYNNYYLPSSTTGTQTFDPNTCIWFGTSGQSFTNGAGYYLYRSSGNNFSVINSGTAQTGWTINGSENGTTGARLYYDAGTDRYMYLNNDATWGVNGNNTTVANRYVLFKVDKYTYAASGTAATISGPTTIGTTGTSAATYTKSTNATYTIGYIDYKFYNNTSHLRNAADDQTITSVPAATEITSSSDYSWSLEGISSTYAEINSSTGVVNYKTYVSSDQAAVVKLTATYGGLTIEASYNVTFEAAKVDPTSLSITSASPMTVYVGNTGNITYSLTPDPCYDNVSFSSASTATATVNGSGVVTGVATGTTTITVTAHKIDNTTTSDLTKTVSVTVKNKVATPVITFTPNPSDNTKATATITCATSGTTIYYTVDDSDDPTSSDLNYTTTGAFTVNEHQVVKAIAIKTTDGTYWDDSDVATGTYVSCSTAVPVISYVQSGTAATVTITAETGATIYYTTNGSNPTTSSSSGTTTVTLNNISSGTTVKAFAKNGTCQASIIETKEIITSSVSGTVVTLYDYEDHNWSYYSDGSTPSQLHSLNPADVKITYYGNGTGTVSTTDGVTPANDSWTADAVGVKVSPSEVAPAENQNTFIYYKTLERADGSTADNPTGRCAYTVIPNPFQVRPVYSSDNTRNIYVQWAKTNSGTGSLVINYIDEDGEDATFTKTYDAQSSTILKVKMGTDFSYSLTCTGTQSTSTATVTIKLDNASGTQIRQATANLEQTVSGVCNTRVSDASGYRGFYKWRIKKIKNGAIYTAATGGTEKTAYVSGNYSENNCLDAEETYYFAPSGEYDMEVELEALWARAYVVSTGNNSSVAVGSNSVGYERNFVVLEKASTNFNFGSDITNKEYPFTVSRYYPNGASGTSTSSTITGTVTLNADTKFENMYFYNMGSSTMTANNHDLIIGRGCTGSVGTLRGISGNADDLDYTLRVESGTFGQFDFVAEVSCTVSGRVQVKSILGCDYDRASGTNTNLSVASGSNMFFTRDVAFSNVSNKDQKVFDLVVKSGEFQKSYWTDDQTGFTYTHSMYCGANFGSSSNNAHYPGVRYVTIEGGALGNVNGGRGTRVDGNNNDPYTTTDGTDAKKISFSLRIKKGAVINGCVFGGAANTSAWGSKRIVLTGGEVLSWIAGGANGTSTNNESRTRGGSYIYVGGDAKVGGPNAIQKNGTLGGQIFGAGRGNQGQAASMDSSFVVIADQAQILKKNNDASGNVYGGGNRGYIDYKSNIYILGGTIEGGVFGGAFSNATAIPQANVTMTGGLVEGGVYGGSNSSGSVDAVTMHIDGGQVGTSSANANVHGGGYGQSTTVSGNVAVNLGTCGAASGATVYGDVYGGSAMGEVNTSSSSSNTTTVSLYKGTIYGGLYGGGYGPGGEAANVYGAVAVNVYGGSVLCSADDPEGEAGTGSVFGCNNVNGAPQSTVTVDIYGTDQPESGYALHAVYGGGNKAAYNGIPVVTIHGCDNKIEYVYGGGNATDVQGTNVTIWGGHIGNAFGGGNGFSITGNHTNASAAHYNPGANITSDGTLLNIYGGTIGAAFGGSNQFGRINSTIEVNVEAKTESNSDPCSGNAYTACPMDIEELYGGGNEAPIQTSTNEWIVPTVKLDCSANIGMLFGGAKAADYGRGIDLVVEGGTFRKVFGGNNKGGTINGNVSVTFKGGTAGAVYGGCNESGTITGTLLVEIDSTNTSCGTFHVGDVYGGGDMAAYTAPTATPNYPIVNIKNGTINGSVYGGGKGATATVKGNPVVTIGDNSDANKYVIVTGNVYGGGDAAPVTGSTSITYNDTNAKSKVDKLFGGGNQASVSSTATVTLTSGKVISGIYGGCNASGGVTSDIAIKINGGTVGSSSTLANIHGGGYGSGTFTGSNVTVTIGNGGEGPNIWGDVYGGSALGNVNADDASLTTKVWLKKGTVNGSLYGGGLGDASNPASVNGNVEVVVDGGSIKKIGTNPASVFGCNNINGSPKRNVTVTINASEATTLDGEGHKVYAINGVYGGGNLAHYDPTTPGEYPQVIINGCETSIKDVYGGGNAAAVPYTKVTVNGGDINRVFAGGNGESGTPANVGYKNTDANPTTDSYGAGTANAIIKGGTINQVFGGSNSNGIIRVSNSVNISQGTETGACPLNLVQLYGGGNMAPGPAGEITIGCTGDQTIDYIYGGANQADVTGDIILNIVGGRFNNVYGGNNISGTVHGKIIVNVDWQGDCDNYLGNVYGGGNLAPYTAPGDPSDPDDPNWNYPQVNIKNGVVSGNVYGGGNGDPTSTTQEPGSVIGNPQVTIGYMEDTERHVTVRGNVYGGGNAAKVTGDTFILMKNKSKVLSNIYGGGNMAPVSGNTKVIVNGKTN